jgi:hypothetical protein
VALYHAISCDNKAGCAFLLWQLGGNGDTHCRAIKIKIKIKIKTYEYYGLKSGFYIHDRKRYRKDIQNEHEHV